MHFLFAKSGQFFAIANLVSQFSVQPSGRSIEKENTYAVIIKRIILDLKINFFYIRGLRFFWLPEIILNQFIIFAKEAWPVSFLAWPCKFQKSTEFFQKEIHLRTSINVNRIFLDSIFEPIYFLKLRPIFDRLSLLIGIFQRFFLGGMLILGQKP